MHVPIVELPPESFPVLIEFFAVSSGAKVWETTVQRPGTNMHRLRVPPLVREHGAVRVRISFADGDVQEAEAIG